MKSEAHLACQESSSAFRRSVSWFVEPPILQQLLEHTETSFACFRTGYDFFPGEVEDLIPGGRPSRQWSVLDAAELGRQYFCNRLAGKRSRSVRHDVPRPLNVHWNPLPAISTSNQNKQLYHSHKSPVTYRSTQSHQYAGLFTLFCGTPRFPRGPSWRGRHNARFPSSLHIPQESQPSLPSQRNSGSRHLRPITCRRQNRPGESYFPPDQCSLL